MPNEPEIRLLTANDAAAYREIRLEALKSEPTAFGDSWEEAVVRPDSYWTSLFSSGSSTFALCRDGQLGGVVTLLPETGRKTSHKAKLIAMYVRPASRGAGGARALVQALLVHARQAGIRQVHLTVTSHNRAAYRLYESAGFKPYGTEPRSLMVDGNTFDEVLMIHFLDEE